LEFSGSDNSKVTKVLCNGKDTECTLTRGGAAKLEVDFTPSMFMLLIEKC